MHRRDAVKATLGGVALITAGSLAACERGTRPAGPGILSADDERLIEDMADTLLPPTSESPGARDAGVGTTINLLLTDCYKPDAQQRVTQGLREFRSLCRMECGGDFTTQDRAERERVLRLVDAEAQTNEEHWFRLVRELSLGAYFSSEAGMTKALRYVPVPGRFTGCVPLEPDQPAWG